MLDARQSQGRYTLIRDDALATLGTSESALKKAAQRLGAKGRLAIPHRGFYVTVPLEHRLAGAPPPDWYIDDLMMHLGRSYYVGLLSAAALHGAAHQQPQEFQVVTDRQLRPMAAGRGRIRFFTRRYLATVPVMEVKTETGVMRVASPEVTALDLLSHLDAAGQLGHVAAVLVELAPKIDPGLLLEAARRENGLPNTQRLGYLLDLVGAGEAGARLAEWVAERRPRYRALRPDRPSGEAQKDRRWRLLINEKIAPDA
ncbi:MAG: type IV toxin-antitoxin system AbiEi family antitoxin [bacterium]|nr:type IV toxin-antitoxin system AbiEi family antitoxin [bacterium]